MVHAVIAGCALTALLPTVRLSVQEPPTWTISSTAVEMGDGAAEDFESVRYGRLLPDGRAVVADVGGLFLRIYAPSGTRLAQMGRRGGGPGEFQSIYALWLTPQQAIAVWDGRTRRFTSFAATGELVATQQIRQDAMAARNLELFLGTFSNGDLLLGDLRLDRRPQPGEVVPERWVLGRFSPAGEFRGAAGEVRGMFRTRRSPMPFSPIARAALRADSLWAIDGFDTELRISAPGGAAVRRIALPWTARRPPRDPWPMLEARLSENTKQFYRELLDEAPRTDQLPMVGGLLLDDRGQLWVKEYEPTLDAIWGKGNALNIGPGGTWRVLGRDGRWLASVRLPDNLIPLDVRAGRLLAVERDELDVERVVVRTVVR